MRDVICERPLADGKLYSGTWTCVNTSNVNVNTQIRKDFETYVEKTVNASKYSASRDKVWYKLCYLNIGSGGPLTL